jgi:hypothetical protein
MELTNRVAYYTIPDFFRFGRLEMWVRNLFIFLKWEVALGWIREKH